MKNAMQRPVIATLLALGLALPALPALAATDVSKVEVNVDLAAIQNPKAAAYWADLSEDLATAIVARVHDQLDTDGVRLKVDIDELALSNSFESAVGIGESRLGGIVNVMSDTDNSKFDTYDLTVGFDRTYLPQGVDPVSITMDSPEYYQAMVQIFADHVTEKLN